MTWHDNLPAISAIASAETWQAALGKILIELGTVVPAYSIGLVYATQSFSHDLADIEILLRQSTGVSNWVGTIGYGVCGTTEEFYDKGAISVLLLPIDKKDYRVFSDITDDTDPTIANMADWLDTTNVPLILTHADPQNQVVMGLIEDLSIETQGYLIGGICAAQGPQSQLADGPTGSGLSGVIFDSTTIPAQTALTQGCSPIGAPHIITEGVENILISLDGKPALDVFKEDIGELLARDLSSVAGYIFAAIPVEGSDQQDYLIRNLTGIDNDHSAMAIAARLPTGAQVMFCRRDHDSAIKDMYRMLENLKSRIGDAPIKAGVYISCAARGPNQFSADEAETKMIADILGPFPLTGFFANGEISHNRIYGYTGVLTLFI